MPLQAEEWDSCVHWRWCKVHSWTWSGIQKLRQQIGGGTVQSNVWKTKEYEVGGCWNIESSLKESCYLVAFGLVQQNRLRLLLVVLWLYIYYFMYCSEMKNKKRPFSNHMSYFTYLVNITSCCVLQVPPIPLHNFYFLTEHEKWKWMQEQKILESLLAMWL